MTGAVVYEIARFREGSDPEELIARHQVIAEAAELRLRDSDGLETPCAGTDIASIVASNADLNEVRADELTRIRGDLHVVN